MINKCSNKSFAIASALTCLLGQLALGTTLYVDISSTNPIPPYTTWDTAAINIQDAVDLTVDGDEVLVNDGVYASGEVISPIGNLRNRLVVLNEISITSVNGPESTFIVGSPDLTSPDGYGTNSIRCAYLTTGILSGFTLQDGSTDGQEGNSYEDMVGGGILLVGSGTIESCIISNNQSGSGGGICIETNGTVQSCDIYHNKAFQFGGGVHIKNGGSLIDSTVNLNSAFLGGGCSIFRNGFISSCIIAGNMASERGGGIRADEGEIEDCTISNNTAGFLGGGIFTFYADLNRCRILENQADEGGGCFFMASGSIHDCLITDNCSSNNGGGLYIRTSFTPVDGCTISGNHSGGIGGGAYTTSPESHLNNCIAWNNTTDSESPDIHRFSAFNSCAGNLLVSGYDNNISDDPLFIDPLNGNYHLSPESPCINAGSNELSSSTNDITRTTRIIHETIDMGCYEYGESVWLSNRILAQTSPGSNCTVRTQIYNSSDTAQTWFVSYETNLTTIIPSAGALQSNSTTEILIELDSSMFKAGYYTTTNHFRFSDLTSIVQIIEFDVLPTETYVSLTGNHDFPYDSLITAATNIQAAVDATIDRGTIFIAAGKYKAGKSQTPGYADWTRVLVKNKKLQSITGPKDTIIEGFIDPLSNSELFTGTNSIRCVYAVNSSISGFTLQSGQSQSPSYGAFGGSGIGLKTGIIENCIIKENAGFGGSITDGVVLNCVISENEDGGLDLISAEALNCTIVSNTGYRGAGITMSDSIVKNSVVKYNIASNHDAGGIYMTGTSRVEDCKIENNESPRYGGGICANDQSVIEGSIICSNTAQRGGGVYLDDEGILTQSKLFHNSATVYGGGVAAMHAGSLVSESLIISNNARYGGGAYIGVSSISGCTLSGNNATYGALNGKSNTVNNCIVWDNISENDPEDLYGTENNLYNVCASSFPIPPPSSCTTNNPLFANADEGNYELSTNSPCNDTGNNTYVLCQYDLAGQHRILDGDANGAAVVDMGAYEFFNPGGQSDSDQISDGDEFIADTDPTDGSDYFQILETMITTNASVRFQSSELRDYNLLYSTNLVSDIWNPVAVPISGSGEIMTLIDPNSPATQRFYRVQVQLP
ncbi:right-handed parallel beta-helix repeat-containing protein [Pontiellaceae bacterium B12227]|nr:right-handed parallel beta-helix repeat-containing protein [Pontiellaceae bacterium B12227]